METQCIAPELIVLRVVSGHAWHKTTEQWLTTGTVTTGIQVHGLGKPQSSLYQPHSKASNSSLMFRAANTNSVYDMYSETPAEQEGEDEREMV
jgi:hypothetical protein